MSMVVARAGGDGTVRELLGPAAGVASPVLRGTSPPGLAPPAVPPGIWASKDAGTGRGETGKAPDAGPGNRGIEDECSTCGSGSEPSSVDGLLLEELVDVRKSPLRKGGYVPGEVLRHEASAVRAPALQLDLSAALLGTAAVAVFGAIAADAAAGISGAAAAEGYAPLLPVTPRNRAIWPSLGSAGHYSGLCKPCDFIHRESCRSGIACKFCHLCGPEEAKLRKRQHKVLARQAHLLHGAAGGA
mmetsp:Transcript_9866/g.34719  ORF Transcript_9866/g.34719 Transcript_9866/m.34719 type:complete len:244 (-) Transcript_9866:118-849(-)